NRHRQVTLRTEFHGLPFKIAYVQGTVWRSARGEGKLQVASMQGKRRSYLIVENPAVCEQKAPHAQFKQRITPGAVRGWPRGRRDVGGSVLSNQNVDVWLLNHKLIKRNPSPPERIDAKSGLDLVCGEQGFRSRRLISMNHETADGQAHGKPSNGHCPQFHFATSCSFQAAN